MTAPHNMYGYSTYSFNKMVPPDQGVFEISSTQKAALGSRIAFDDGRVYRYAKAGATALAAGKFVKVGAMAAQVNMAVSAAVTVGNNSVTLTTTSASTTPTDGYLQINAGTGVGQQFKFRSVAANATTTTSTDVELYDPIGIALDTTSYGSLYYNPYEQCEVVTAQTDIILGVPTTTVTAEYYFWLQTWGPACVLSQNTPTAGYTVFASTSAGTTVNITTSTAGASVPAQALGVQWQLGVANQYKMVNLMIMP